MKRVCSLLLAAALALPTASAEDADQQVTTVSVFVPGYRKENWDDLAGSAITSVSSQYMGHLHSQYSSLGSVTDTDTVGQRRHNIYNILPRYTGL